MIFQYVKSGIAVALIVLASQAVAAGNIEAGKTKSVTCQGCHGADGNSVMATWPKLAGQHASYIAKQVNDFKSGARKDPTMTAMAAPVSAEDIEDIAAYYSAQVIKTETADKALAAEGEKIFRAGNKETGMAACMACHGPAGTGNAAANFPSLAGQHVDYVVKALNDFRSGTRTNDNAKMMQDVAGKMSDAEIKAVAAYISGLH